ncbi:FtsX-like permease family protein [Umboniibacter marinipuniceus]|uniref:Lipoprotein-releasing system permease protein n=1 Tax=Umboniibacter marinipuniceus TaxID=569599 RepID=A0A3M0A984_9GAMM|nr:FtsX-like permease family protein [Umboniibacter marinipuniceus]RMA81166.1 lipoprotein-releasing system permease protein [Umboniibacter marinipuniceus]
MRFSFDVGQRYSKVSQQGSLIGFISSLAGKGLALSVAILVVVIAVIDGFERELEERILNLVPHVELSRYGGIEEWQQTIEVLEALPEVTSAAPYINQSVLFKSGTTVAPGMLSAVDLELEAQFSPLANFVEAGDLSALSDGESIVLGAGIAEKLDLSVGQLFTLMIPGDSATTQPTIRRLKVVAIIASGTELDQVLAITTIDSAQAWLKRSRVDGIKLKLTDLYRADITGLLISESLGGGYTSKSWQRQFRQLSFAIQTSKQMINLLLLLIILAAVFNVVTTLTMVVIEKKSDIAILRSMGASRFAIMRIFVSQGFMVGVYAALKGILAGILVCLVLPWLGELIELFSGVTLLSSDVYPVDFIPVFLKVETIALVAGVAICASSLVSVFPAWRASRVDPAKVLQLEI